MTIAQVKTEYLRLCGDKYASVHYQNFVGTDLSLQIVVDWLLLRNKQDNSPIFNLNNTINIEPNDFTWDWFTLIK